MLAESRLMLDGAIVFDKICNKKKSRFLNKKVQGC